MKTIKRIILPLVLAAMLLVANTATAFAASIGSYKEEVIYVKLESSGAARNFYAVNIFTMDGGGTITDYGSYSSVRNMTTEDAITQTGDMLTIATAADKLYYEGVMDSAELPWIISIRYTLDGKEIAPSELAGKAGALQIKLKISENPKAADGFYDSYALQVSASLDTNKCEDIVAAGATVANVGNEKQIAYTVLPGKGLDAVITANVQDFEMDGISINGVGLALDLEIDTSEVTDKVAELQDGVVKLNDGADDLQDGANGLYDGADGIADGAVELRDGANKLYTGMDKLETGAKKLQNGLARMKTGATDIQTGLNALQGNSEAIRNGSAQVSTTLAQLKTAVSQFETLLTQLGALAGGSQDAMNGITGLYNGLNGLNTQLSGINTTALINANNGATLALTQAEGQVPGLDLSAAKGVLAANNTAWGGVAQAQAVIGGQGGLLAGATDLKNNYTTINDGIQNLYAQLSDINTGLIALKTAIDDLEAAYNDLQTGMDVSLQTYTAGVDAAAAGYADLYAALYGADGVSSGADSLASGISDARAVSLKLYNGASDLSSGATKLKDGLSDLRAGASELADGTQELYDKTATMDDDINARIDEMIAELTGSDIAPSSFVSPKNKSVRSVQFVMVADPIEKAEKTETVAVPVSEPGFLERFFDLFR